MAANFSADDDQHPATQPPLFKREAVDGKDAAAAIFFGCAYCSQVFLEKVGLETHIRLLHNAAPYCCTPAPLPKGQAELLHQPKTTLFSEGIPLSEVARHNVPDDCWVALNGKVYDLTEFLDRHPGGRTTIMAWAGKDASKFFNGIHQEMWIQQYLRPEAYLGELGVKEGQMSDAFWDSLRQQRIRELREELHYYTDLEGAKESAAPEVACYGLQSEKVQARLRDLEARKMAAIEAEDYEKAEDLKKASRKLTRQASGASMGGASPKPGPVSGIPLSEVQKHNKRDDCWVALNGKVFDLADFVACNPEGCNPILAVAGRDATSNWNKIPGRFPSEAWDKEHLRPEFEIGDLGEERKLSAREAMLRELQQELRQLEGPTEAARAAAAAAMAAKGGTTAAAAAAKSEEDRFPRLREVKAAHGALPLFTRAEVAQHTGADAEMKPYIILHNKVYDLSPLLGNHPGGDDVLLSRAGTDCTQDFEVFEHSEKARVKRDQEMLVGELVPEDRRDFSAKAEGAVGDGGAAQAQSELAIWARQKGYDAVAAFVAWYIYKTAMHRKPLSQLTYSRALRHMHFLMAVGIFGAIGTVQVASRSEGLVKKRYLRLHKQTGLVMLFALVVRTLLRVRSGIPPRFPGNKAVQFVESQSLRAFYALCLALPVTGIAYDYFLYWAPALQQEESKEDDERNERNAKQAMTAHRYLGKFLEYAWLPFHLGYTGAYHYSQGRGVIRKVSPFI